MKKTLLATLLAAGAVFCASSAFAADSVDLKVIGTITPVACIPTLSGTGTVDYGTIKADTLKADAYTLLPIKSLDFAITCDGKAKLALRGINGRIGSLAGATEGVSGFGNIASGVFGAASNGSAGLGLTSDNKKIGGYGARVSSAAGVKADNIAVDTIYRNDPADNWLANSTGLFMNSTNRQISWATTGTVVPVAFKTLAGTLEVQAYINKSSELDITKPIHLDGLTTLELIYL
jgi:opacity protein-like surface antigen